MDKVIGIDVSAHQGRLTRDNWRRAAAAGVKYVWARIADGITHLDPTVGENLQEARNAGMLVGGYLFFRATRDPAEQAALALSQARQLDLPIALDCEQGSDMGLPQEVVRRGVRSCLERIEGEEGRVIVYTCIGWWEPWMGKVAAPWDLWIAHYDVARPLVPTAFAHQGWSFWQHTSKAKVDGMPKAGVDQNFWKGSLDELRAYSERRC